MKALRFNGYTFDEAVLGMCAYDSGDTDGGINDKLLKELIADYILHIHEEELRFILSRLLRDSFLSEEALAMGYGWEDAIAVVRWLESL